MSTPSSPQPPSDGSSLLFGDTDDRVMKGHKYDGIREYDNPMPGWWVWLFVSCVVFAVVYFVGITFMGFINTYQDDLAESQQELAAMRASYAEANPVFQADEVSLAAYVEDLAQAEAGAALFATNCAACHGAQGQGVIGPNLADPYWIHDASNVGIFNVITEGVLDKGMTPWGNILTPEERAQLVAFVRSLEGTDPPNPKEPQGELVE